MKSVFSGLVPGHNRESQSAHKEGENHLPHIMIV